MKRIVGKNIVLTGCNSGSGYEFLKLIAPRQQSVVRRLSHIFMDTFRLIIYLFCQVTAAATSATI